MVKCCCAKNRRRAEHHDLLAVLRRLERRADRDLGLAVADVAADQAVHRLVGLHVGLDVGDRRELIGRLLERERRFHLELPGRVFSVGVALDRGAPRVQVDQVERERAGRLARLAGRLGPVGGVEARDARRGRVRADELGDPVDLLDRDVELVALGVLEQQVVVLLAENLLAHDLLEERDAVRGVNDVVAGHEGEGDLGGIDLAACSADRRARVDVVDRDDGDLGVGDDEAGGHVGIDHLDGALGERTVSKRIGVRGRSGVIARRLHAHAGLGEQVGDLAPRAAVGHGERDRVAGGEQRADAADEALLAARDLGAAGGQLGVDARAGAEDRQQREALARAEVELGRREVEAVELHAGGVGERGEFFSATNGVVEERAGLGHHGEDIGAEVLGGHRGALVEQRQEQLDAVEEDALLEQLELVCEERVLQGLVTQRLLRELDAARADAEFSAGEDLDGLGVTDRLPGRGNEAQERLDLVAEKLGPHRRETACREDVENAAANRELAGVLGELDALVAHTRQAHGSLLEVDLEPDAERERIEDAAALRRHHPQERARRGDDDDRTVLLQ